MTYCVALKLNAGLVFASDSRTNAGVDQIACFKKMRTFVNPDDRIIVIMSSGNLSITQNAINLLEQRGRHFDQRNIWNVDSMFEVAQLLGEALREVRQHDGVFLAQNNVDASANFIVGGQLRGEAMRLFLVYAEGNFIEAGEETPYFQIGETKYGKPIIDRVINSDTPLSDAVKCVLVSFDSTMRSNLSWAPSTRCYPASLSWFQRHYPGRCLFFPDQPALERGLKGVLCCPIRNAAGYRCELVSADY